MVRYSTDSIHHVWSEYPMGDAAAKRRHALAKETWKIQPWREWPIPDSKLPRLFSDAGGAVPYLRDLIDAVNAKDRDIIVYTNADICVPTNCCERLLYALKALDACYAHRFDFVKLSKPVPDSMVESGSHYAGMDLFAFRKSWWSSIRSQMPDMLIGRQSWDSILQHIILGTHPKTECSISGMCYHEKHKSVWEDPKFNRTLPSQMHNIQLAKRWCAAHGVNGAELGIR